MLFCNQFYPHPSLWAQYDRGRSDGAQNVGDTGLVGDHAPDRLTAGRDSRFASPVFKLHRDRDLIRRVFDSGGAFLF